MKRYRAAVDDFYRDDLAAFTHRCFKTVVPGQTYLQNWHVEAIAYQLERCRRREIRRLLITLPPRSLKSICASVAFPAFALGHDPTLRIVCVSYSQELAAKHARDCRAVLESPWYERLFPGTRIDRRKNTEGEIETTARGFRLATSLGGTFTGRGGNLILIDDPMKPTDAASETQRRSVAEWFDSTLASRLDQKTEDVIVLIMQRLHVDDLVGHVLEKGTPWVHLNLPAIAEEVQEIEVGPGRTYRRELGELLDPEREPLSVLDELKVQMGSQKFSAQYQQQPVPPGGEIIRREWLRTYAGTLTPQPGDRIVQSWDTASKADKTSHYSVCTTWLKCKNNDYYLLDVLRIRLEYPKLKRRIVSHAQAHGAKTILIEDASSGKALIQDLRGEGIRPIAMKPTGDKIVRVDAQTAVIEAGHVFLPEEAPWLADFLSEILAFPYGRFDDQVDSFSQFLTYAAKPQSRYHFG